MADQASETLSFFHFNDVYNIERHAARFVSKMSALRSECDPDSCITVFSGDAFNPSLLSTVSKGAQMVPVLNAIGIDVALFGNHDFDFGLDQLQQLCNDCNFRWLMSNVDDIEGGHKLGGGLTTMMLTRGKKKIGFVGLIEQEWLATLATIDEEETNYEDFVQCAIRLAQELRAAGADMIVAVTHMRLHNDERLAREAGSSIDIILGGHDHDYSIKTVNGCLIVKSGTDFRDLSRITVVWDTEGPRFDVQRHSVTEGDPEDPTIVDVVKSYTTKIEKKLLRVAGQTELPLEARFSALRTRESNLGNFICDAMVDACHADCAILNSGTIRSDRILPPGGITHKDLQQMLPLIDELCVIGLTGAQLLLALENGVSKFPAHEGRFPQVSRLSFRFNPLQEPGARVEVSSVKVNGAPLDRTAEYKVATKAYLGKGGKDGYSIFQEGRLIYDEETLPPLPTVIRNRFKALRVLNEWGGHVPHSKVTPCRRSALIRLCHTVHESVQSTDSKLNAPPSSPLTRVLSDAAMDEKSDENAVYSRWRDLAIGARNGEPDSVPVSPASSESPSFHRSPKPDQMTSVFKIRPVLEGRILCTLTEITRGIASIVDKYDAFILDQYGVLHNGAEALPGVAECLHELKRAGKLLCINSNSSKLASDTQKKLVTKHNMPELQDTLMITSGQLMMTELQSRWRGRRVILFGWDEPRPDIAELGLSFTDDPANADFLLAGGSSGITDASGKVLVASDMENTGDISTFLEILKSAQEQSLPMLVANNDLISRRPDGTLKYNAGVIADRYDQLGGSTIRFGKPGKEIFEACVIELSRHGITDRKRIVHVGDSLHHDVAGAAAAGIASVFITGGVHAEELSILPGEVPDADALGNLFSGCGLWPTHTLARFAWK